MVTPHVCVSAPEPRFERFHPRVCRAPLGFVALQGCQLPKRVWHPMEPPTRAQKDGYNSEKHHAWHLIDPRISKRIGTWDTVTGVSQRQKRSRHLVLPSSTDPRSRALQVALVFTALVTPYEVALLESGNWGDFLFLVNRLIDLLFIADIGIQFILIAEVDSGGAN